MDYYALQQRIGQLERESALHQRNWETEQRRNVELTQRLELAEAGDPALRRLVRQERARADAAITREKGLEEQLASAYNQLAFERRRQATPEVKGA